VKVAIGVSEGVNVAVGVLDGVESGYSLSEVSVGVSMEKW